MADKNGDFASRIVGGVAAAAAGFATRKVMTTVWKKATGKEPPARPEDLEIALGEAIAWSAVIAVAMSTTRLLATRAAAKRMQRPPSPPAPSVEAS